MSDDTASNASHIDTEEEEEEEEEDDEEVSIATCTTFEGDEDDDDDDDEDGPMYSPLLHYRDATTKQHQQFTTTTTFKRRTAWGCLAEQTGGQDSSSSPAANELLAATERGDTGTVISILFQMAQNGGASSSSGAAKNDINAVVDRQGRSALHTAIREGHPHLAQLLIIHGAAVNQQDKKGRTALHYAIFSPFCALTFGSFLYYAAANPLARDVKGETPLHAAVRRGCVATARDLIQVFAADANEKVLIVNAHDNNGATPLHHAVQQRKAHMVVCLLEQGADANAMDNNHAIPMDYLAKLVGMEKLTSILTMNNHHPDLSSSSRDDPAHKIAKHLISAGSFGPTRNLLQTLFYAGTILKVDAWLERMVHAMGNMHEFKLFCTIVSIAVKLGLLTDKQATHVTSFSLKKGLSLCHTVQDCDLLLAAVQHAEQHGRLERARPELMRRANERQASDTSESPTSLQEYLQQVLADDSTSAVEHLNLFRDECLKTRYLATNPEISKQENNHILVHALISLMGALVKTLMNDGSSELCAQVVDVLHIPPPGSWTLDAHFESMFGDEVLFGEAFMLHPVTPISEILIEDGISLLGVCTGALRAVQSLLQSGKSPLHLMCNDNNFHPEWVEQTVLKYPSLVYARDDMGQLPLHLLCQNTNSHAVGDGISSTVEILMGEDTLECAHTKNVTGQTALHCACLVLDRPSFAIINAICRICPGSLLIRDNRGFLPIHLACMKSGVDRRVVNRLIPSNHPNNGGGRPRTGPSSVQSPSFEGSTLYCGRADCVSGTSQLGTMRVVLPQSFGESVAGLQSVSTRAGTNRWDNRGQADQFPGDADDFQDVPSPMELAQQSGVSEDILFLLGERLPEYLRGHDDGIVPRIESSSASTRSHTSSSTGSSRRRSRRRSRRESRRRRRQNEEALSRRRHLEDALQVFGDTALSAKDANNLPLHKYVKYGDLTALEMALAEPHPGLNALDSEDRTALDLACLTGQREVFSLLQAHGAEACRIREFAEIMLEQREQHVDGYLWMIRSNETVIAEAVSIRPVQVLDPIVHDDASAISHES